MRRPALILLALFVCAPAALGQQRYERKSISYINALWLATPEARQVNQEQVGYMLSVIKEQIEMERFDYNPLPDRMIAEFVDAANARDELTVDELARLMERELTPTIVSILEGAMPERAGELVSEEKRQGFIATKAKELGITLEEIEKVMNSAYIYLPVLTGYKREESKTEGKFTYTLEGGIIWFRADMSGDYPAVELKVAKTTMSKGFGSDRFAYQSAVRNYARNLQTATRAIEEFRLSAPIAEVEGGRVGFRLGTREGIHMDDCFLVGEWVEHPDGKVRFERSGWTRVGKVADNSADKVALSYAWAVKRGSWAPGMLAVEHPRLNIDIALKPMMFYMKVTEGRIPLLGSSIFIRQDYESYAPGLDLDAHYNLAGVTGISQLFFLVGGNFVFPATLDLESNTFTMLTATPPFVWGVHGGLLKRFCMGQLAVSTEVKGGMRFFTVEQDFTFGLTGYKYTVRNNTGGVMFNLGLDWAASPDFNLGVMAGYRLLPISEIWTQELEPFGEIFAVDDQFPDIDHSGLAFGLYFHWTPPELPFDPADWLRGAWE